MNASSRSDPFVAQATGIVAELQGHLSRMIEAKCGADLATTRIAEVFGIHRKLAWQISRVAYDQDPFTAARHMPSEKGVRLFLGTARTKGVDGESLVAIEQAAVRFEELVASHGGDREAFDLMLSACSATQDDEEASRWREQAFIGNSFIWGAQCRTLQSTIVQFPNAAKSGYFDMAQVRSLVGLRLNKPHTHWPVCQTTIHAGGVSSASVMRREPIDPESAQGGAPVMRAHCKGDLPEFVRRENLEAGVVDDLLIPSSVGLKGERTIVVGEVIRALAPAHATPEDPIANFGMGVRTPARAVVLDLFCHRDLFVGMPREARVYSDLHGPMASSESDRLGINAELQDLGMGFGKSQCRDVPGYPALVRDIFDRLGQKAEEFRLHRIAFAFPPMPASVMVRMPLPPSERLNR